MPAVLVTPSYGFMYRTFYRQRSLLKAASLPSVTRMINYRVVQIPQAIATYR